MAPQVETKAERKEAGRPGAMDFVPKTLGWGVGGSGVLRGARAAGVGVGRGCSLQGASAGLRGRQQRGRVAISGVCVEVQPPVSFAQRQIVSFAQTGAFPPPETQGDRSRQSGSRRREKRDRSRVKKTGRAPSCLSPPPLWAGLAERAERGGPPCFRSFCILKWAASGTGNAGPRDLGSAPRSSTACRPVARRPWLLLSRPSCRELPVSPALGTSVHSSAWSLHGPHALRGA